MSRSPLRIISIGAITPAGGTWRQTWTRLLEGRCFARPASLLGLPFDQDIAVAGVCDFDWTGDANLAPTARLIRTAVADAGVDSSDPSLRRWGASNHGDTDQLAQRSPVSATLGQQVFGEVPHTWLASACTSGLHCIHFARLEAQGRSGDWLVASGDALSPSGIAGFFRLGATGIRSAEPFHQSSPGMTVSEGAVALRLSNHQGADGPALLGTGISSDAGHPTHPDPSGVWLEQAISDALRAARTDPADVAGVIAHGTGTTANDSIEAGVIGRIFGEAIPVTSIKGALGHIMGAAGLLNLAVACEAWATGVLPPTLGNGPTWPGANVAPTERNLRRRRPLLALASGFGGNNVAALIG